MKSSIAPAARSSRQVRVVRVESRVRGPAGIAAPAARTVRDRASAAEFRRFSGEAPARFRDYMGYHGHDWSSMESGGAAAHPRPNINDPLGLIFRETVTSACLH